MEASPRDPRVLRMTEEVYLMDAGSWSALYGSLEGSSSPGPEA